MSLSQITDVLKLIRQYGIDILQLLVTLAVAMIILGTIIASAFTGPDQGPPVMFPDHPRSEETGCTRIDGVDICPEPERSVNAGIEPVSSAAMKAVRSNLADSMLPLRRKGEKRGKASPEAVKAVKMVSKVLEIDRDFKVYSATFERSPIAYVRYSLFKAEIVYDRDYFAMEDERQAMTWIFAFIMGHEAGHTASFDPRNRDPWGSEASADYLGAMAVYRLGGDLKDALEATSLFSEFGSASHPARVFRREAITLGWKHARDQHLNPSSQCRTAFVGPQVTLDDKVCIMAATCQSLDTPIQMACQDDDGQWSWL